MVCVGGGVGGAVRSWCTDDVQCRLEELRVSVLCLASVSFVSCTCVCLCVCALLRWRIISRSSVLCVCVIGVCQSGPPSCVCAGAMCLLNSLPNLYAFMHACNLRCVQYRSFVLVCSRSLSLGLSMQLFDTPARATIPVCDTYVNTSKMHFTHTHTHRLAHAHTHNQLERALCQTRCYPSTPKPPRMHHLPALRCVRHAVSQPAIRTHPFNTHVDARLTHNKIIRCLPCELRVCVCAC